MKSKFIRFQALSAKLKTFLSANMSKTFSQKEKFSVYFFSFRSSDRKAHFVVMAVAKTGLGLEVLGNFKRYC